MKILQYFGRLFGISYDNPVNNDSKLRLRTHHISALDNYMTSQKNDPKERAYVGRVHGPRVLAKLDEISNRENMLVTIVEGFDDICKVCSCLKHCKKGEYGRVGEIVRKAGEEIFGEPRSYEINPEQLDADVSELLEIRPGEIYSLYVLLKKWKRNAMFLLNVKQRRRFKQFKVQGEENEILELKEETQ